MVHKVLFVLVKIFFFLMFIGTVLNAKEKPIDAYGKYVSEIVRDFAQDMKSKYDIHCIGSGGSMHKDIEKIQIIFHAKRTASIDEARKIEVDAIEQLLVMINNHEKIRPYLREYPFDSSRVGVSISFYTKNNERPLDGSVSHVTMARQKIFYDASEMRMVQPKKIIDARMDKTKDLDDLLCEDKDCPYKSRAPRPMHYFVPLLEEPYEEALKIVQDTSGQ